MAQHQPDLFQDHLLIQIHRGGMDAQRAFEIYCADNKIDPCIDCKETSAAKIMVQRIWAG
jgi:hypothetical protein